MVEPAETVADDPPEALTTLARGRLADPEPGMLVSLERIMLGPKKARAYRLRIDEDGAVAHDAEGVAQRGPLSDDELATVRGLVEHATSIPSYHANERARGGWVDIVTIGDASHRVWVRNASTELTEGLEALIDWDEDDEAEAESEDTGTGWSLRSVFRR